MNCERCGKRLTRKGARMIGGVVMCAPCMFGQAPRDSDAADRPRREAGSASQAPAARAEGIAHTPQGDPQ